MDRLGKPFELLVTHVTKHYGLVKIVGQTDLKAGQLTQLIVVDWVKLYQGIEAFMLINTSITQGYILCISIIISHQINFQIQKDVILRLFIPFLLQFYSFPFICLFPLIIFFTLWSQHPPPPHSIMHNIYPCPPTSWEIF